ncbi:diguanylate cyclase domain-containing protein [Paenibacillus sp. YYML68]|uniref:sensor domain-containing diguanylate cyclase n=1 Tax=Paenibacillus sp. YYML68 TaxID=2909250 RepID=UPI00248F7261|nr:diguanylate cyclase [Paenibacillus sp. YYML68]
MKQVHHVLSYRIWLLVAVVLSCVLAAGCTNDKEYIRNMKPPTAHNGLLDLSRSGTEAMYKLDGEWQFSYNRLLTPQEFDKEPYESVQVPSSWTSYVDDGKRKKLPSYGSATYRLDILLPTEAKGQVWAVHIPAVYSAYTLWLNGEEVLRNGVVGDRLTELPSRQSRIVDFHVQSEKLTLVMHASNQVSRNGGITSSIKLGKSDVIYKASKAQTSVEMFLAGGLIIMALYHVGLYVLRRVEPEPLYFGAFCLALGVRSLFTGEKVIYSFTTAISWQAALRIEYVALVVGVCSFALFLHRVFPKELHRRAVVMITSVCTLYGLICLLMPPRFSTYCLIYFQAFMLALVVYTVYIYVMAIVRRRAMALLSALGAVCFFVTVVNDILTSRGFIQTEFYVTHGLYAFIIFQSFILAIRFSRALVTSEVLARKLLIVNSSLEEMVQERTQKLEEMNEALLKQSLCDALTGIANRRHFNSMAQAMLQAGDDFSLLLMDIDHFKKFNDTYGHYAGDDCLVKVAQTLQKESEAYGGMAARYGGEEFAVLAPVGLVGARKLAERLVAQVQELSIPHAGSETSSYVTISCGVVCWSELQREKADLQLLINTADDALYAAKRMGRNRYYDAHEE